ncbi:MAG: radical SAM protein [Pseudomonadota bacterium]
MKVALLLTASSKQGFINKDISAGLGTVSHYGNSFAGRVLTIIKKKGIQYPPLVMGYLAALLRNKGVEVEVYQNKLPRNSDLVILYGSLVDYQDELKWARKVRQELKVPVGFVGAFPSIQPERFLQEADFVITGEPEGYFLNDFFPGSIPRGIIPSLPVQELDSLPYPDWSVFPLEQFKYRPYFMSKRDQRFFPMISSRGCPMGCFHYCPYPSIYGRKWRSRSIENVIGEMEILVSRFRAGQILFRDPIFSLNRQRTEALARALIQKKWDLEYVCETHLSTLDEDLLKILFDSGLRAIKVGVESASPEVLKESHRASDSFVHQEKILACCDRLGIAVTAFYILGFPTDTKESIKATVEYARKLNTVGAQFTLFTPYPGTQIFEEMKPVINKDYEAFDIYTPVFKHQNLTENELIKLKGWAYQSYYVRLRWLWKFLRRFI